MTTTQGFPNIAFVGKAGAGKSSAAEAVKEISDTRYQLVSFADPLRDVAEKLWGYNARSNRTSLQDLGMAVRNIEAYTWVRMWVTSVNRYDKIPVVTDDLRFENEWWAAKGLGFVIIRVVADRLIRVDRLRATNKLQHEDQLDHESETALDHMDADYTITNTGNKLELAEHLVRILEREVKLR